MGVGVSRPEGDDRPAQEEIERALANAREELAADRVECPDVEPLELPYRRYHLWTGPLRSATAFRHQPHDPPSLIWPEDRSWFVGVPIYTKEIAVAGTTVVVDAVVADPRLNAHLGTPDDPRTSTTDPSGKGKATQAGQLALIRVIARSSPSTEAQFVGHRRR